MFKQTVDKYVGFGNTQVPSKRATCNNTLGSNFATPKKLQTGVHNFQFSKPIPDRPHHDWTNLEDFCVIPGPEKLTPPEREVPGSPTEPKSSGI